MVDIKSVGTSTGSPINVELSYRIIELFSAGLYSSPNKAFEELVTNSYDAEAKKVAVGVPSDFSTEDYLWVLDDGESMDSAGLHNLWKIGESNKREKGKEHARKQIGKFGIGKLATYILTHQLTYVCKSRGKYLAVTMDYDALEKDETRTKSIALDERKLTRKEAKEIVEEFTLVHGEDLSPFALFGAGAEKTWTFCLMTKLKTKARDIAPGRLQWILRTALPLNPNFKLYYNGKRLESSKIANKAEKQWIIGKSDGVVANNENYKTTKYQNKPAVNLPHIKNITGTITYYEDSFATGTKSEEQGRSHGIFLMVRDRLINLDDPLLGMGPFGHGAFNRTRMMVYADELDDHITSTRESIKDSPALADLKKYLGSKFNEVHSYYMDKRKRKDVESSAPFKLSNSAYSLSRGPIFSAAHKLLDGEIADLQLISVPEFDNDDDKSLFLDSVKVDLESEEGLIQSFEREFENPANPICRFELEDRNVVLNMVHPYSYYLAEEHVDANVIEIIASMEVLLEAQMIEADIPDSVRISLLEKRDRTFRNLSQQNPHSAAAVAQGIADAESDANGLEDVLVDAFNILGFSATRLGKNGRPDGIGIAELVRHSKISSDSYKLIWDAKSTIHTKASSTNISIAGIDRHRDDYSADFACVIARDYQGGGDDTSKICKEALKNKVTLIRTKDLGKLLYIAIPQQLNLYDLKDFFSTCYTPTQTAAWIAGLEKREVAKIPYKDLVYGLHRMQSEDNERVTVEGFRYKDPKFTNYSSAEITQMIEMLSRQVPKYVHIEGNAVSVNSKPEVIMKALKDTYVPPEFQNLYKKVNN